MQAWRPFLRRDIDGLEQIQHRATKMIEECRNLNYENRLLLTGLTTLEDRRNRGDMIQVFKIVKGLDKLEQNNFFALEGTDRTRGHRFKLSKNTSRLEIRKNFFNQRIVIQWNELPDSVVEAESVNCYKNKLDKCIAERKSRERK